MKKIEKKNVLVLRRPEDEVISLFAGLLANPDVPLSLDLDGAPIKSTSHTHPSHFTLVNFSSINLVSIFRYSSSSKNPVYVRHVNSSYLGSSLSSRRQSYIGLVFSSRFIDLIKKKNPRLDKTEAETLFGSVCLPKPKGEVHTESQF